MTPGGNITLSYNATAISNEKYIHACKSVFLLRASTIIYMWFIVESAGRLLVSKVI